MMMRMPSGIDAQGTVMHTQLAEQAALDEGVEGLVHGSQRDTWDVLADTLEDLFRAGMAREGHQGLVDHGSLMSNSQAMLTAEIPEARCGGCLHAVLDEQGFGRILFR